MVLNIYCYSETSAKLYQATAKNNGYNPINRENRTINGASKSFEGLPFHHDWPNRISRRATYQTPSPKRHFLFCFLYRFHGNRFFWQLPDDYVARSMKFYVSINVQDHLVQLHQSTCSLWCRINIPFLRKRIGTNCFFPKLSGLVMCGLILNRKS